MSDPFTMPVDQVHMVIGGMRAEDSLLVGNIVSLTKRELFAAMAMQGMLAVRADDSDDHIAQWSVMQADALLAELAK